MCFVLVASRFFPLSLRFTSTTRLFQLHHGSWTAVVWAEGRGGWWESEFFWWQIGSLWGLLFVLLPFPLNQRFGLRERRLQGWVQLALWGICRGCCAAPEQTTPWEWACQVCHHGDRQSDRHIEESVALLLSLPPSPPPPPHPPCPHTTLGTHMLPLCHSEEPASSALCPVELRVKFSVCSRFQSWLVARLKQQCF